jgi:hypothetical protein
MKQATAGHKIGVIIVIKSGLSAIEWSQSGVTTRSRATSPSSSGKAGINVGVIVYAVTKCGASGKANCVTPRERSHVTSTQAFGRKHGD